MEIKSGDGINIVFIKKPLSNNRKETYVILFDDSPEQAVAAHQVAAAWAEDRSFRFNWKDKYRMSKKITSEYIKRLDSDCKGK